MNWTPITSLPPADVVVLIAWSAARYPHQAEPVATGFWNGREWIYEDNADYKLVCHPAPTHWADLPDPPE